MLGQMLRLLMLGGLLSLAGCALFQNNRVVFVSAADDVVRLDSDCKGHVFTQNAKGEWVRSGKKVNLPAGWYAGPGPK